MQDYLRYLWMEIIYAVVTIIYIILLHTLNKELLSKTFESDLNLLQYNDWEPVKYFVFALALGIIGIFLVVKQILNIIKQYVSFAELVCLLLSIVVIVSLLAIVVKLIQVPILKAVFSVLVLGGGVLYGNSQSG